MTDTLAARLKRRVGKTILGEIGWTRRNGSFRDRERYGLISRPNYAYGMLRAADVANYFGLRHVTVVEFGVAAGAGLLNMVDLAPLIERETGVSLRIVGFDAGGGLPNPQGYKDHPELWMPGDFPTPNREELLRKLGGRAEIIWGNVADTIGPFMETLRPSAPLGFVAVDLDLYSSTKAALTCLTGTSDKYNPAISMYFDDVNFFFANEWCGELAAIAEFNLEKGMRRIAPDRTLLGRWPNRLAPWSQSMYVCHVLDHDARQTSHRKIPLDLRGHAELMMSRHLF